VKRFYLDLFSGIGGFALGAFRAGIRFDDHYFSEVDEYAISVYRKRFPEAIPLGDIKKIDGTKLPQGKWILSGGFPCQDISIAGKGAGLAGNRSGLWYEYARLIGEIRPEFAIMENVGAITFRGLDGVLGSLAEIGYDAEWQDIRASDLGAPHQRERIWILAYPEGQRFKGCNAVQGNSKTFKTGGGGQ
jgi:DNA (cytosine-5)-methyltransferase 1